jgi:hypothetical protein
MAGQWDGIVLVGRWPHDVIRGSWGVARQAVIDATAATLERGLRESPT